MATNTATALSSSTTTTGLQDLPKCRLSNDQVHKLLTTTLDQPLTGRTVLLPVTGQAFTIGQLKPAVLLVNHNSKEEEEVEQVQILASPTSSLATVSTKQAQAWLQPKPKAAEATAATKPKSVLKHKNKFTPPPTSTSTNMKSQASTSPSRLAFMDIQEEYDASGKQVRSGAVNISQQLNAVWNNAQEPAMVDDEQGWNDNDDIGGDDEQEKTMVQPSANTTSTTPKQQPTPVLSDDDYKRLADRLDELALLEETGAAAPSQSVPKPTTKKQTPTSSTKKQTPSSSSGWGKGFLTNNKNAKSKPSSKQPKAISFGANQIQEIPRIGTTPASTITQQRQTKQSQTTTRNNKQSRPIASSVFNGVVQERPVVTEQIQQRSVIRERPVVVERQKQQAQHQPQPTSAAPSKKRVSRFAQERGTQ
jgi:hypothetical protein